MLSRYTERAQKAMGLAKEEARRLGWDSVDKGHLFLGLVREGNGLAAVALQNLGLELDEVRRCVDGMLDRGPQFQSSSGAGADKLEFTSRAIHVLTEEALSVSRQLGHNYVGTEHILLALLRDAEAVPARALAQLHVTVDDVRSLILASVQPATKAPPPAGSELPYTERLLRQVLPLAAQEAQALGDDHLGTEHLLLGILRFGKGRIHDLLHSKGVTLDWLREELRRSS